MVQRLPAGYVFDPEDPRAPSVEQWARMSAEERARVVTLRDEAGPGPDPVELAAKLREERRLREAAERQLAEARAEIERLKKGAP